MKRQKSETEFKLFFFSFLLLLAFLSGFSFWNHWNIFGVNFVGLISGSFPLMFLLPQTRPKIVEQARKGFFGD
jgi:hypothetical protein